MRCLRCDHSWVPRKLDVRVCPQCKSYLWDKPKAASCDRCGTTSADVGRTLARHHIDGNHGNDAPENVKEVCQSCHMMIHQEGWKEEGRKPFKGHK